MSEARPGTWFSGQSSPDSPDPVGPDSGVVRIVLSAIALIIAPIPLLIGFLCYLAFQFGRVSHKVFTAVAAGYTVLWVVSGAPFRDPVRSYLAPYKEIVAAFQSGGAAAVQPDWAGWLAAQASLGILLGLWAGAALTAWRWLRRPVWDHHRLRLTPWEWSRYRKTRRAIESDEGAPSNGRTVGVDPQTGRRVVLTDQEAAAHMFVVGASGAGKTVSLLMQSRDVIRRGQGLVYVDLKGAKDVPEVLADYAARYGRRFLHFVIQDSRMPYNGPADGAAYYDPAGRGDPSRRKDLLIGAKKWDVEYYKQVVENYLQTAFRVASIVPPQEGIATFDDLVTLLQPERLADRASMIPPTHPDYPTLMAECARLLNGTEAQERSGVRSMLAYIQTFVGSTGGAWLKKDPQGLRDIDLRRAADEGWVVCFSLDSSNYEGMSAAIAGLIVQDLKTLSSELRDRPAPAPFNIILDEFQAIGSDNVLGLIDKCRDANMPVTLSTQAIGNLLAIDPQFVSRVIGIVNCFLIHRANDVNNDGQVYAGLTGMERKFKKVMRVESKSAMPGGAVGLGAHTGSGMIEEFDDYRVLPREIVELRRGEAVFVAKSPVSRVVYPVEVVREIPERVMSRRDGGALRAAPTRALPDTHSPVPPSPSTTSGAPVDNPALTAALDAVQHAPRGHVPVSSGRREPLSMWGTGVNPALEAVPLTQPPSPVPAPVDTQPTGAMPSSSGPSPITPRPQPELPIAPPAAAAPPPRPGRVALPTAPPPSTRPHAASQEPTVAVTSPQDVAAALDVPEIR